MKKIRLRTVVLAAHVLFILPLFSVLAARTALAAESAVETTDLIIRDVTGSLPPEAFATRVAETESMFANVLKFWEADPRIGAFGKIFVEFDYPLKKTLTSFFYWRQAANGKSERVVRVFGAKDRPQLLAHKLTSAVFPNPDKLIRNMMGEVSEGRFGNAMSWPRCGFSPDDWVVAEQRAGHFIPLADLGPNHEDWGMRVVNNAPTVFDRTKQQAAYSEAGSFGEFMVSSYGIGKMKLLNRQSRNALRPWKDVFGNDLEALQTEWLGAVQARTQKDGKSISTLVSLLKRDPSDACYDAQNLARGGM